MRCGLVVLNYNDYPTTVRFIDAVRDNAEIDDIVIVDNHSTNESFEVLSGAASRDRGTIKALRADRNGGYSCGNNIGCRYLIDVCGDDVIFVSNPDVVFDAPFVRRFKDAFACHGEYAALTGLMLNPDGSPDPRPFLFINGYLEDLLSCFWLGRFAYARKNRGRLRVDYGAEIQDIEGAPGSLFAIRARDLADIGYLDENTFLFYEEIILATRIRNLGKKIGLLTGATFVHAHSATIGKYVKSAEKRRIYLDSVSYFHKRYTGINAFQYWLLRAFARASVAEAYAAIPLKMLFRFISRQRSL